MALASLVAQTREFAPGMLDVRAWEVRTLVDDAAVGSVHDLLLDVDGLVRWLDLALASGRHVLLPAGQGRADQRRRRIWLPGLSTEQVELLPSYAHDLGALDAVAETDLLAAYQAVLLREAWNPPSAEPPVRTARPNDPRLDPRALFPWEAG